MTTADKTMPPLWRAARLVFGIALLAAASFFIAQAYADAEGGIARVYVRGSNRYVYLRGVAAVTFGTGIAAIAAALASAGVIMLAACRTGRDDHPFVRRARIAFVAFLVAGIVICSVAVWCRRWLNS